MDGWAEGQRDRCREEWTNSWEKDGRLALQMGRWLRGWGWGCGASLGMDRQWIEGGRDSQLRDRGTLSPLPRARARQDGERWASALQRAQREALEREATRGAEQARQQELIRDMKGRLLELLR